MRMTKKRKEILGFIKNSGGVQNTYALYTAGLASTNAVLHRMVESGLLVHVYSVREFTPGSPGSWKKVWRNIEEVPAVYLPELEKRIAGTNQSSYWVLRNTF